MSQPHTNNKLLYEFYHNYNITPKDITYPVKKDPWKNDFENLELFKCDNAKKRNGDFLIYYVGLDGTQVKHNNKGTPNITVRRRLLNPFKNNDGQQVKYLMDGNNVIYYPPQLLDAFNKKTVIDVLIVTEGEKKAFVAAKHGFDCVGISGIWNFCEVDKDDDEKQGGLLPSLKTFLKVCQVKKVVLLHDSDALDMGTNKKKSPTDRPNAFFKSTKRFAELIFQEGVQFFYTYINPHLSTTDKLGLDDLIVKHEDFTGVDNFTGGATHNLPKLLLELIESVNGNKKTTHFCTTKIEYLKDSWIRQIFQLGDPEDFYKYHKAALKDYKEFRFENRVFTINHAENKIEEKKITGRESVWITDGQYHAYTQNGTPKIVSNFTMNVLFLLKSHTNPKRIVEFKNVLGQAFITELSMDDLTSVSSFRKKLIAFGSFIYKGDMYELLNISEMLFREEKNATELTSLGWQKGNGFFAWSNGITSAGKFHPVDEFGVVSYHDTKYYLPAFSSLYDDATEAYENERNFKHIDNEVTFEEWATLFYKVYRNNGAVAICFGVASMFRDIIFGMYKEFPILNLFGQKSSGKSTVAKSLLNLFGVPQGAISLESDSSTKKGIARKFMQYRNALVWLDEYKNSIKPDKIGLLKGLFDGIGYEKAQTDQSNRTVSTPVLSSAILSGQDVPTADIALLTRVILLMFNQNQFNEDEIKDYEALKAFEKRGITSITNYLLGHREIIEKNFIVEFKKWFEKLSEQFKYDDINDRMLKSMAMVIAPVNLLVEKDLIKLPFTITELYTKAVEILKQHKAMLNDNQEVNVFWDVIETLYDEGVLSFDKGDFRFIGDTIAIRFNRMFNAYSEKYRKMHGKNGLDQLTLKNYLKHTAAFVEIKSQVKFETQNSSAWVFKYNELGINLERIVQGKPDEKIEQSAHAIDAKTTAINTNGDNDDLPF